MIQYYPYFSQDSTVLHVTILDINDNSPEFEPSPFESLSTYIKSIDEGPDSVDSVVIDINATDKDFGLNAEIRYSMAGDNHGYFQVDSITVGFVQFSYLVIRYSSYNPAGLYNLPRRRNLTTVRNVCEAKQRRCLF